MAPRIQIQRRSPKRPLDLSRGYFYPGEVVRILKLEGLDYRQIRHLFRIAREQADAPAPAGRKWARFTFRDLVALKTAFLLAGGEEALAPGRRLRLGDVEQICRRLRHDLGLGHPLTEIAFRRRGKTVVAQVQGLLFEPASGQMLIAEVEDAVEQYLNAFPERLKGEMGRRLRESLLQEAGEMRAGDQGAKLAASLEVSFR